MRLPLPLISLIILSNATLLPAQVYKWVDNEGKTHYGDKLQSNASETVHIRKKAALDSNHQSRSETTTRLLNVLDKECNEKKKLKAQAAKDKRELAAKCIRAKKELEEIKKTSFLYKKPKDPKNPTIYNHEEREKITSGAEKAIQTFCK